MASSYSSVSSWSDGEDKYRKSWERVYATVLEEFELKWKAKEKANESGGQLSSDSHKKSGECKGDSFGITDVIVHIEEGTPYEVISKASKPKKRKNDNKSNQKRDIFNLSIHKKVKINDENEDSIDIQSLNRFNWKASTQSKGVDIAIINKNREKGVAVGMIRIEGFAEKTMSKTRDYVTNFTVFFGVLNLKIDDKKPVVVRTGNAFTVNSKRSYSLVNLRKDEAYISFTVISD